MAIFEAEHRHKTASEDQLTSRIFGALAILDKRNILFQFLLKLASAQGHQLMKLHNYLVGLTDEDRDKLEVKLWAHFGHRHYGEGYPDVYIEGVPKCLIVIEAKENTKATSEQIIKQYHSVIRGDHGESENDVVYFLLTKDEVKPRVVGEAKKRLKRHDAKICWVQWKQVWRWLSEIRDEETRPFSATDKGLLKDLIQLTEDKGMASFTGIRSEWFTEQIASSLDSLNRLFVESQYLALSLRNPEGRGRGISELGLIEQRGKDFFRIYEVPKQKAAPTENQRIIPEWIELLYKDVQWRGRRDLSKAAIYISVGLGTGLSIGFYKERVACRSKEWGRLQKEASKLGLRFDPEPPTKEKADVYVYRSLLEASGGGAEPQLVNREHVLKALEGIRDFVRRSYEITNRSEAKTKSRRERG